MTQPKEVHKPFVAKTAQIARSVGGTCLRLEDPSGPFSPTDFRAPRRRVSVASVVGNLLTNRPIEHGFMVLQENYDLSIRQTSVVIG